MGGMTLELRTARIEDADRLGEEWARAYPGPPGSSGTAASRAASLRADPAAIERVTIAERNGLLVGIVKTIPFTAWIGGVATRVGGMASVAVAPEARHGGVATALVRRHVENLRAVRATWSLLYPFSARFYARHEWAPAARRLRWQVPPIALPLGAERQRVRRVSLDEPADRAAIQAAYEEHCIRTNGSLSRSAAELAALHHGRFAVGVDGAGGRLTGYLFYSIHAPMERPQTLVVVEWLAEDGASERALLGFLSSQRDQIQTVTIDTAEDYPLDAVLDSGVPDVLGRDVPPEHHPLATVYSGMMARIIDLGGALRERGYPGTSRGVVAIAVTRDALCADNVTTLTVTVADGRADVVPGRRDGAPLVTGPIGALSAVLIGGLRLDAAHRFGLVTVDGDLATAASVLGLPPPAPLVSF
jgi:predicted acetyltransferase